MANEDIGIPQLDKTFRNLQYNNAFDPQEDTMLQNIRKTARLHNKLLNMGDNAYNKFASLDNNVQDMLRAFYGEETEYMIEPQSGFGGALNTLKNIVGGVITSPFRLLFKGLEEYSDVLNGVQNQVLQWWENGTPLFDKDVWHTSLYEGETLYNNELDKIYTEKYGREEAFIAKMVLANRKPGEIVKAYGKLDDKFVAALESFFNEPEKWETGILEDYRQAKLSVGRSLGRWFYGSRKGQEEIQDGFLYDVMHAIGFDDFSLDANTRDKLFTIGSGSTDLTYQILADPLTYLTFGASTGVKFAGKGISQLAKANEFARAGNISELFKIKKVREFWDGYGVQINELKIARDAGDFAKQAEIKDLIKRDFARHGTDEDIEYFLEIQKTIKDRAMGADDVAVHFNAISDFTRLLAGRTTDASYYLDSVAIARRQRSVTNILRKAWYKLNHSADEVGDVNTLSKQVEDEFLQLGDNTTDIKADTPTLRMFSRDNINFRRKVVNLIAKNPSDEAIIVGDDAALTLQTVVNIATIFVPPNVARAIGERFLAADQAERIVMLRGMYRGIMFLFGIDKSPRGMDAIEAMIDSRFTMALTTQKGLNVPKHVVDAKGDGIVYSSIDDGVINIDGGLHENTLTNTVGNLNWDLIRQEAANIAVMSGGKSKSKSGRVNLLHAVGGATNSTLSSKVVDTWSLLTLAPKLGVRSSIDEMFFFILSAPRQVLFNFLAQRGKAGSRAVTRFTGSKEAQGPVANVLRKVVGKVYKFPGLDPAKDIDLVARKDLLQEAIQIATEKGLPEAAVVPIFKGLLAHEAVSYSRLLPEQAMNDMEELLTSNSHVIESAASSVARRTGMTGAIEESVAVNLNLPTMLTIAREELKIVLGDRWRLIDPKTLTEHQLKVIMYDEFYRRFWKNQFAGMDVGEQFIKRNALDTAEDYRLFVDDIVYRFLDKGNITAKGLEFLSRRAGTIALRKQGMTDEQILRYYAEGIASDLYTIFHGGGDQFNADLLMWFRRVDENGNPIDFYKSLSALSFDEYSPLAQSALRKTEIPTNIEKIGDDFEPTMANWWKLAGEKVWEWMDRTVTAIVRQPVVTSYYLHYREMFRPQEIEFYEKTVRDFILRSWMEGKQGVGKFIQINDSGEASVVGKLDDFLEESFTSSQMQGILERAQRITGKRFAEAASRSAVNHTLKYVDNPHVRSQMVSAVRNINRFARATEDFWRRIYRLKDVSAQAFYRARLMHAGLNSVGSVERDQDGNEYFMLPMDDILYAGIDPVLRALGGGDASFKQPMFNNLTVQLTAMNPSFQDQAGIPFLSGPIAGLSVWTLKGIAKQFGGQPGEMLAEEMDNFLLGDIGDNIDLRKAIVPAFLDRMWKMMDSDEQAQHNHSAVLSAIAYNQAYGRGLSPTATAAEKAEYLENVRISGHNLVFLRSALSTILPFSVGSQEDVDLPDYIRNTGITSIRSEYFDILDAVFEKYGADVSDPYELAAAIFVGENPNKLVYTVSREDKKVKPLLRKTEAVKKWIIGNREFINKYGEAAYFFAPQIGDLSIGMYSWMEAAGLVDDVDIKDYLTDVQVAVDKQRYFAISDWEDEQLAQTGYIDARRVVVNQATQMREALKLSNPLLRAEIEGSGFDVSYEKEMLDLFYQVLEDPNSPLSESQIKRMTTALNVFQRGYSYVQSENIKVISGYSELKRGMKYRVLDELNAMALGDPLVSQMVRLVFKPLLNYYSRDTASIETNRQYSSLGGMG